MTQSMPPNFSDCLGAALVVEDSLPDLLMSGDLALDIEYGNVHGFFSAARDLGPFDLGKESVTRSFSGLLHCASLRMTDRVEIADDHLQRELSVFADEGAQTYDVVSRFVIKDRSRRPAWIHGRVVEHGANSTYNQFPAGKAVVPVGSQHWLTFDIDAAGDYPPQMAHVIYVRDEAVEHAGYRWVVHQRLIAQPPGLPLHLRGCHPRYNRALPAWLDGLVPAFLKQPLYRVRETRCPRSPIMAVAHATWRAGMQASLTSTIRLSHGPAPF